MTMRRGITLVEVLIMSVIGLMLLGVSWFLFQSAQRQSRKLDARMRAIQASSLLTERLKADLKQFYPIPNLSMVDTSPPRLSFYIFRDYNVAPKEQVQKSVNAEPITYIFDRESHYVIRNAEVLRFSAFEDIQFSVREPVPGPPPDYASWVTVRGVYVPEEMLATPERITDRDRVTWTSSFGLPQRAMNDIYNFWIDNPFDRLNR